MLIVDKKILTCDIKEVYFSDNPHDIESCDFLKFYYCKNKVQVKGFTCQKEITSTIDLTKNLDTIWKNMDNNSVRYRIKRAQKEGVKIKINDGYEQFFQIYRSFRQKKGLKSLFDMFGVGAYTLDAMKKYGTLFLAEHEGEILVGTLYLEDEYNMKSWLGASKRLEVDKAKASMISCADRLIDWEAIQYAKEKGLEEYDLGGLWLKEEAEKDEKKRGMNNYKLSFGGEITNRYSYLKIYSKIYNIAYNLYILKNLDSRKSDGRF